MGFQGRVFRVLDEPSERVIAKGEIVVACVSKFGDEGRLRSVPIPEAIAVLIEPAQAELLESCL